MFQNWLDGQWDPKQFLVVQPKEKVVPSYDENVIVATKAEG